MNNKNKLLKFFGLSDYECGVYLNLLNKPDGESIDTIISTYNIPSDQLNNVVGRLVDKGLVNVKRNRMEANDPKNFLSRIVDEKRRETESAFQEIFQKASILESVLEPIFFEKRLGIKPEELLETIEDLSDMTVRTSKIINEASNEIFIFSGKFDWYEDIEEDFKKTLSRGVRAKILMLVIDQYTRKRAKGLKELGAEVKHCVEKWYPVRGTMVDEDELIFVIWSTKKDIPRPIHYKPHYTKNIGLIRIFSDAFKKRWEEALPFE